MTENPKPDSNTEARIWKAIAGLDIGRIQKAMEALNWTWIGTADGVPTTDEIRQNIYDNAKLLLESNISAISSGGIRAEKDDNGFIRIAFEVSEYDEAGEEGAYER